MTQNPNAYPSNTSVPEQTAHPFWHKAAVGVGAVILAAGCTSGGESKDANQTSSAEPTAVAPAPSTAGRELLQLECWKHPVTNTFIEVGVEAAIEIDLVKQVRGQTGVVARLLFDADAKGMDVSIQPTGHEHVDRAWTNQELSDDMGQSVYFYGKTFLRYPSWSDAKSGKQYVTYTVGCDVVEHKADTPIPPGMSTTAPNASENAPSNVSYNRQ